MNKQGYVIAQRRTSNKYFTASSAYDQPVWTTLAEATVYATAELANSAATKLWTRGSFSARLVSLQELEDMSVAPMQPDPEEMTAKHQEDICDVCKHYPCTCPTDDDQDDDDELEQLDDVDTETTDDEGELEHHEDNENAISPSELSLLKGKRPDSSIPSPRVGNNKLGESYVNPNKPQKDAKPSENKTTVCDLKPVPVIAFTNSATNADDMNIADDIQDFSAAIKVPANVMKSITSAITDFEKCAKKCDGIDDSKASLSLTIVDALKSLKQDLDQGTVEGLRQAQIRVNTFMNPITSNFPPELTDYLYKSGRQPISLKSLFNTKWDEKRKKLV